LDHALPAAPHFTGVIAMRWILVAFVLLAGPAQAKDCEPPKKEGREITGLIGFSKCMIDKVADLERENAELRTELEKIQASLSKFPGELRSENGRVTRTGGENLVQASFTTSARRREAPASLGIDQKALEALCVIGCTVNLVLTAEGLRKEDPGPVSAVATCNFRYTAKSGAWTQGGGCGEPVSGVDGNGKPPGKSGGEVIAVSGGACMLADSEPSRSVDDEGELLGGDRAKGLFLIAAPALWTGKEDRFRCELKLGR
jgi:hypothetical protein